MRFFLMLLLISLLGACETPQAADPAPPKGLRPEQAAVLFTVERFFEGIKRGDSVLLREVFAGEGQSISVRYQETDTVIRLASHEPFFRQLAGPPMAEAIGEPEIRIHRDIATLWAPYAFWANEQLSHCGEEVFSLVREAGKWKIMAILYTVEKGDCMTDWPSPPQFGT
ncbi:MAG: hypothetical protein AAFR61_26510 [Bacteroidota bacterium]